MSRPPILLALVSLAACATYTARPVRTSDAATRFNERRLDDPGVRRALDSAGVQVAPGGWDDAALAEAAWLLRPERARLAAEVQVAEAARISAGARERPGLLTETEYSFSGTNGESRWGVALSGVFTVEFGGKRGARLARANAGVLAAIARSDLESWEVRWRVHQAAVRRAMSTRLLASANREADLADSVARLLRQRYDEGVLSRSEVARAEADRQSALADVASQRRDQAATQAELAAAIGIAGAELDRVPLAETPLHGCPEPLVHDSLQEAALQSRRALRVVLADYQVAEAEVRLEVAHSWPDLQLGPGLFFDHGVGKWTVGFGLPSLPLNRNRGPIAEAEARREVAANRIAELPGAGAGRDGAGGGRLRGGSRGGRGARSRRGSRAALAGGGRVRPGRVGATRGGAHPDGTRPGRAAHGGARGTASGGRSGAGARPRCMGPAGWTRRREEGAMIRTWRKTTLTIAVAGLLGGCADNRRPDDTEGVANGPPATMASVGGEATIVLDSATVTRIGLRTVALARSAQAPEVVLPAQVVEDPGALTTVRAGVGGRLTEANGRGWPRVGERLTAGEEIAQVGDARPVTVPRAGTVLRLLAQPGELVQPGQALLELTDFGTTLVRVAGDESNGRPPASVALTGLSGGARFEGRFLGPAAEADPTTRGPAWMYRVAGSEALRPGAALLAHLPDPRGRRGGVLLPSEAVVQWDALAWAFVERTPGHFVESGFPPSCRSPGAGWPSRASLPGTVWL